MAKPRASGWKLLIIPDDQSGVRQYRFTRVGATVLVSIAALIILYTAVETVLFWVVARRASQVEPLRQRVRELESSNREMERLGAEVTQLRGFEQQLRRMLAGGSSDESMPVPWSDDEIGSWSPDEPSDSPIEAGHTTSNPVADARGVGGIAYTAMDVPTLPPVRGYVTRGYSPSEPHRQVAHYGLDIAAREGTPVLAAADGLVVFSDWTYRYGNLVAIAHRSGFITFYGHNQILLIKSGERVRQAEPIALVGNSGLSTAPHLHFEVWQDGSPIDPLSLLAQAP